MLSREGFKSLIGEVITLDNPELTPTYDHCISTLDTLYDAYDDLHEEVSVVPLTKGKTAEEIYAYETLGHTDEMRKESFERMWKKGLVETGKNYDGKLYKILTSFEILLREYANQVKPTEER